MIVLGFDTSTSATAVALRQADGRTTQARDDPPAGAHPGHATRLLDLAAGLLADAGIAWSSIERLAVGVGPGTFTGLRVGVASARGLAQSLSIQLVGVSSTRALAAEGLATPDDLTPPSDGPALERGPNAVLAVIDARRGEVFAAAYELGARAAPHELAPPRALAPAKLANVLGEARAAADGAPRRWLAIGDGARRYRDLLQGLPVQTPPDASPLHLVSAAWICELGASAPATGIHEVVPDYRRRPDAELALVGTAAGQSK